MPTGSDIPSLKCRPVTVKMFGKEYLLLDSFPKAFATDMITLVDCMRRKKPCKLSQERLENLDLTLKKQNSCIDEIRGQIEEIRKGAADKFDANNYYDDSRVEAYTKEFKDVQFKHTSRCIYLLPDLSNSLVLDLGCGSGLSTQRLCSSTSSSFVVGVDASEAMLRLARKDQLQLENSSVTPESQDFYLADFVLADFNVPLPFRKNAFDNSSSTSAVHYVKPARRKEFLLEIANIVKEDSAFQLFPKDGIQELPSFIESSPFPNSLVVVDKPHHKDERYYLLYTKATDISSCSDRCHSCNLLGIENIPLSLKPYCRCLLAFPPKDVLEPGHIEWLQREHERCNRRELRVKRRLAELTHGQSSCEVDEQFQKQQRLDGEK